ncbi:hypothetical protein [Rhizobium sp. 22-785-1]
MNANLKNFEATFLAHGTERNLIVRADNLDQALKAARIKLNMRNLADCEIIGLRRQGPAHTAVFDQDVDISDPFAVLFQVAIAIQADLSLTLDGKTPESIAFFLAARCFEDHGHQLPEAISKEALRLENAVRWHSRIGYEDGRPPLDPIQSITDIAYELCEEWLTNGKRALTWEEENALSHGHDISIDYDEGVDFSANSIAYVYLLVVGAYKLGEGENDYLVHCAERIVARFMAANPSASEVISNSFRQDEPTPTWAGVPTNW